MLQVQKVVKYITSFATHFCSEKPSLVVGYYSWEGIFMTTKDKQSLLGSRLAALQNGVGSSLPANVALPLLLQNFFALWSAQIPLVLSGIPTTWNINHSWLLLERTICKGDTPAFRCLIQPLEDLPHFSHCCLLKQKRIGDPWFSSIRRVSNKLW